MSLKWFSGWSSSQFSRLTLRWRFTLFYTLLVALILGVAGFVTHVALENSLSENLRSSLESAVGLGVGLVQGDGVNARLRQAEPLLKLPSDLILALVNSDGGFLDAIGRVPSGLPPITPGFSSWDEYRIFAQAVRGNMLLALRNYDRVEVSVAELDRTSLVLWPLSVLLALGLGHVLSGRALRPLDQLTTSAFDLARRRAWRERLPEPTTRDELWRVSRAANTLLESLGSVIESERRFTQDAAHELRTPLTVLRGRLEQALERDNGPSGPNPALEAAHTASEDLLALVEKLLLLARAESGQNLTLEVVALDEIAFNVGEMLSPDFAAKSLEYRFDPPVQPILVRGDRMAFEVIVRNLLENALKFTPDGSVLLEVIAVRDLARLTVTDTGPGIPEAMLEQVFERFYQADVIHRRGGSGLGLAIARSIARWHGGEITAHNNQPGGASFTLELPMLAIPTPV